jgi:hypothetical protein
MVGEEILGVFSLKKLVSTIPAYTFFSGAERKAKKDHCAATEA